MFWHNLQQLLLKYSKWLAVSLSILSLPITTVQHNGIGSNHSRKLERSVAAKQKSREWYQEMHHLISFDTIQSFDHGVLLLLNPRKHELPLRATYLPGTRWYKHGKLVTAKAFAKGDRVYIAPAVTEHTSLETIAISDNFLYAARVLEKYTILIDGVVEHWTSLQNTLIVRTKDGKKLTMSYDYAPDSSWFYSYMPGEGDRARFRVIRNGDFFYILSVKPEKPTSKKPPGR